MNDTPKPADRRPLREDAQEALRADYLALETDAKYVFRDREPTSHERAAAAAVSRLGQQHPTDYDDAVAALADEMDVPAGEKPNPGQCSSAGPNGTRILHDEGHGWVSIGAAPIWVRQCMSCHRIDQDDLAYWVRRAQAKALREAAECDSSHLYTGPCHDARGVDAVLVTDLERRAAELERGDTDAR